MWIEAILKCDVDHTPYRVYINDELITERFYAKDDRTISNNLVLEVKDAKDYSVTIENAPGHPKTRVWIEEVKWQEERYEN